MVIARNTEHVQLAKHLSTQAKSDPVEFVHDQIGFNYRLSNLCAAVGVAQMERLDEFIERKRYHATLYETALSQNECWAIVPEPEGCLGTYWMVLLRTRETREGVVKQVRAWSQEGIGVRPIWRPLHMIPLYRKGFYFGGNCAEAAYERTFCLPSSVGLSEDEIDRVVTVFTR